MLISLQLSLLDGCIHVAASTWLLQASRLKTLQVGLAKTLRHQQQLARQVPSTATTCFPSHPLAVLPRSFDPLQVGLGEGFAPSAATSVLAWQVPSTERSRAVTTVWGGLDVGSAVGLLLSGPLIRMYGWPSVFYLFAVLGGIWCLLWPLVRPGMQVRLGCRCSRFHA
jgi:MFS family permease